MAIRQWDEDMSVGVESIDEQHKLLLALFNETFEAVHDHDENRVFELLDRMREYGEEHFRDEEQMMLDAGYELLNTHRMQHEEFSKQVNELHKNRFENTNLTRLFTLLNSWLTRHILHEDQKFFSARSTDA